MIELRASPLAQGAKARRSAAVLKTALARAGTVPGTRELEVDAGFSNDADKIGTTPTLVDFQTMIEVAGNESEIVPCVFVASIEVQEIHDAGRRAIRLHETAAITAVPTRAVFRVRSMHARVRRKRCAAALRLARLLVPRCARVDDLRADASR